MLFLTHLATADISHATIKVYLSVVWYMHVSKGLHNQFNQQLTHWLQFILRGIKKYQTYPEFAYPSQSRSYTAYEDFSHRSLVHNYANTTLWAAYSLAFFGFLHVSEFTIPQEGLYDSSCHLSLQDIAWTHLGYYRWS